MISNQQNRIEMTLASLFADAKYDYLKMLKGVAKSIFSPLKPSDFKDAYLSITKEQGEDLKRLVTENGIRNIVEFGTSFGISTLFLAQAAMETKGRIITTELIESKARKAMEHFQEAGVDHLIDVRIGNALETLKHHDEPIDLLFLDGWKDLYLPLFQMLESNFHPQTIIYVDNADMADAQLFLGAVRQSGKYVLQSLFGGKAVLIKIK